MDTVSEFALSGKPHLDCPQGYGEWQEYKEIDYSAYTVTVHVSPDCQPETLQALGEMMKLLIQQVEKDPSQRSRLTQRVPDLGWVCAECEFTNLEVDSVCQLCFTARPSG